MANPVVRDPNDAKVVEFFNNTDFDFTPELGAMFDGVPYQVNSGVKRFFPYHIGHRLAVNLAKAVLIKGAPLHDPNASNPVGTPLWGDEKVKALEASFISSAYMDEAPVALSEMERLHAKVRELEKLFLEKEALKPLDAPREEVKSIQELVAPELNKPVEPKVEKVYQDKQEVIDELVKRGIKVDRRNKKEDLEKLLV